MSQTSELTDAASPHPGTTPQDWYTAPSVLDLERRRLFDHSWSLVGTVDQLSEAGSYLTATVGTCPLVVVRDDEGALHAFHNICRHRGAPLVEGAGRCGRFLTCPYHQWSYQLDGALRRAPQTEDQFPDMDYSQWGLHPAAAGTWHGMVFANPDPLAPTLSASLGDLGARLEPFLSGPLVEVASAQYIAACNWKLLVENHVDVYHLWYLHNRSLSMYDHTQFNWEQLGDNWWSLEPLKRPALLAPGALPWLGPGERDGIGAYLFFPNLMLVTTGHYFASYDAVPLTPASTLLTFRVRSTAAADAEGLVAGIRSFMAEDVAMCERLQVAAGSARSPSAPWPVRTNARYVLSTRPWPAAAMAEPRTPATFLDGAWRRAGLSLEGGPFVEHSNVLWLQAGEFFADLRSPYGPVEPARRHLDGAQAFSGHSHYEPPRMTWRHDLDTMPRAAGHQDTAVVEHHGAMLVERGNGYVERWQLEGVPSGAALVAQRHQPGSGALVARLVVIAHLALAVWREPVVGGAALACRRGAWAETDSVGGRADLDLSLLDAVEVLAQGNGKMTAGWHKIS